MRNPYTVSNLMDVCEGYLFDMQSLAKYNDMHRYILSVIDIFSKYLHLVPVKTKSRQSISSAFRSLFHDDDSRLPVLLRTDKGKEFLNKHFQDMLREEGIQFQVFKNPDVKCAVVEMCSLDDHRYIVQIFHVQIFLPLCRSFAEICQGLQ